MSGHNSKIQPWKAAVADQDSSITSDGGTTDAPRATVCVPGTYEGKNDVEETLHDTGKGAGTGGKHAGATDAPLATVCVPGTYEGKNDVEETLYDTGKGTGTGNNVGSANVGVNERTD